MDQRHRLAAGPEEVGAVGQVDGAVEDLFETEVLGGGGGQEQSGVGHGVVVIEGHPDPVKAVRCSHPEDGLLIG